MTSAVDGLKQRFMAMSQPDADGVYRNGAAKRKARTELAMGNLTQLWNEACEAVSFDVPATGIGLGAVGSLARGQVGPSSDLDLAVIYEPHALTDQQLNELANKLWYPIWDSGLDLDQSVRTVAQCEAVTDRDWTYRKHSRIHIGTMAQGRAQTSAGTARLRQIAPRRIRPHGLHQPAGHQGGTWWPARLRIGVRARRILACRPSARHV